MRIEKWIRAMNIWGSATTWENIAHLKMHFLDVYMCIQWCRSPLEAVGWTNGEPLIEIAGVPTWKHFSQYVNAVPQISSQWQRRRPLFPICSSLKQGESLMWETCGDIETHWSVSASIGPRRRRPLSQPPKHRKSCKVLRQRKCLWGHVRRQGKQGHSHYELNEESNDCTILLRSFNDLAACVRTIGH